MKFSVSTCSFYKYRIRRLLSLGPDMGVEIFCEFGSDDMWTSLMCSLNESGKRPFSIHAPFAFVDIGAKCDEGKLFDSLMRPFDLYHRFDGDFYVVHTYGDEAAAAVGQDRDYSRKLAAERLAKFNELCKRENVRLAAENLCAGAEPLFSQEQFLGLFEQIPDMDCVIDVGHALVSGMDISTLQKSLNSRICAYHLHDNDGTKDAHLRLGEGICQWKTFAENCRRYTPEAVGVLEYMDVVDLKAYEEDRAFLESLM